MDHEIAWLKLAPALPNSTHQHRNRADMKNGHPIDHASSAEQLAACEWDALLARMCATPDARLQQMRDAIATGAFHVDARNIAERLIRRLLAT